ncbi:unnamed protein product [Prorocentrum cordatum]|uniref:Transmembrane protein 138 n=1 Tax=Prorocentrum cordatum TaxID=2364126 RepID=A0ABN9PF34_9DINO|nr:unnamed protein product [Polarella glacialis]
MDLIPMMTIMIRLVIDVVETAELMQEASLVAQVLALFVDLILGRLAMVIRGLAALFAKPHLGVGLNVVYVVMQWLWVVLEALSLLSFEWSRLSLLTQGLAGFSLNIVILPVGYRGPICIVQKIILLKPLRICMSFQMVLSFLMIVSF